MADNSGLPIMLNSLDSAQSLERLPLDQPPFTEAQLQEILRRHPNVLPLGDIEPVFEPAFCIGREVRTAAGFIDNLYISATGHLALIETKLWKNPQARREAVAQVIDYARELANWTYQDLEKTACTYQEMHENRSASLYEWLSNQTEMNLDEADFVDRASRNLRRGAFLLAIVGEGIREGVEAMVEYLQGTPQLAFTLALIELACYRIDEGKDWPIVIVPRTVMRTAEVERAVVTVRMKADVAKEIDVDVTLPKVDPDGERKPPRKLTADEFYEELANHTDSETSAKIREWAADFDSSDSSIVQVSYGTKSLQLRIQGPEGHDPPESSLLNIRSIGHIQVNMWLPTHLKKWKLPEQIALQFWTRLGEIHRDLQPRAAVGTRVSGYRTERLPLSQALAHFDAIKQAIRGFEAAFDRAHEELHTE